MNYQVREYRGLTSSIKAWMSECRTPSKTAILCSIISQAYKDQEIQPLNVTPRIILSAEESPTAQPKFSVPELQPVDMKLGSPLKKPDWYLKSSGDQRKSIESAVVEDVSFNTSTQSNPNESDLSYKTANESIWVEDKEKCTPKKTPKPRSYERYPEAIRYKIEFFETGVAPVVNKESEIKLPKPKENSPQIWKRIRKDQAVPSLKKAKAPGPPLNNEIQPNQHRPRANSPQSNLISDHAVPRVDKVNKDKDTTLKVEVQQEGPIVTHMVLKQNVVDQLNAIREQAELSHLDCSFEDSLLNCERKKTEGDEKFIVNLYECRSSKKWPRVKAAVKGGFERVSSKLFIKPTPDDTDDNKTSSDDTSSSVETCKAANLTFVANSGYNKPAVDMDTSTVSNISALLDKSAISESSVSDASELCESVSSETDLLDEVHNQCRIMQEATKAVEVCSTVKELAYGKEQLEAERILLLAGLKRSLLLKQMREKDYGGAPKSQLKSGEARLTLSDIELPLMLPEDHQDYKIWYVITCTCESILQASQLIELRRHCHFLNFTGSFVFENVHPYSAINLKVYQVKIRNAPSSNRRLNKLCCLPQISTLTIRKSQKVQYRDLYSGMVVQSEILPSIFTLCGSLDITMDLLLTKKNFLLNSTPNDSTLFGSLKLTAQVSNFSINQTHFGFLTIGREQHGAVVWERKWCHLEGTIMSFWDNPSEETFNPPNTVVDLKNCIEDKVEEAAKQFCRRHVILLDVAGFDKEDNQNLVMIKYYLSADTSACLKKWKKRINSVLESLSLWKALGEHFEV